MITTKQRAQLKSIAANIDTIAQVGKDGLNENVIKSLDLALNARELIKIKVLNNCDMDIREVCDKLCEVLKAEPVLVVGSKIILYRYSKKKDIKHIQLVK